jgi:hypothetical protein
VPRLISCALGIAAVLFTACHGEQPLPLVPGVPPLSEQIFNAFNTNNFELSGTTGDHICLCDQTALYPNQLLSRARPRASYEMRQVRYHHPVPQPPQGPRVCVCCHGRGRIQLLSWAYNIALRRCDLTFWALGCRGTGVKGCGAQQRRAAAPVLGRKDAKVLLNINWTRYQGRKGGEGAELLALGALSAWICWKEITGTCHMGTPICKGGRANPHVP